MDTTKISKFVGVKMILVCQLPADVMLFFGVFPSNLFFTSMGKIGMN